MLRRRPTLVATAGLALAGLLAALPASQAGVKPSDHLSRTLQGGDSGDFPGAEVPVGDADRRGPHLAVPASAKAAVTRLGKGVSATWTQFGTPLTLTREADFLATGLAGSPEQVARTFLVRNAAAYGLSPAAIARLELVSAQHLPDSTTAWAVIMRQKLDGIRLAEDGLVTVGVGAGGKVAYVTSSLVPTAVLGTLASTTPKLSPNAAVLAAAKDAGITGLGLSGVTLGRVDGNGFQTLRAKGLHQLQRTRLRVLPTTDRGARLVYETNITDVANGRALAVIGFVDAVTGDVLLRRDAVDTFAEAGAVNAAAPKAAAPKAAAPRAAAYLVGTPGFFTGDYNPAKCTAPIDLTGVAPGDVTMAIMVVMAFQPNDIVLKVQRNGTEIGSIDTVESPEAGTVTFTPPILPTDKVTATVCPFTVGAGEAPFNFAGSYNSQATALPQPGGLPAPLTDGTQSGPSIFHVFGSNPQVPLTMAPAADTRYKACSGKKGDPNLLSKDVTGCDYVYTDGSPLPYDADPIAGLPSFTTAGNNAITSDARASSSLTPGAPFLPPVSPTRDYQPPWTDSWHLADCDPASIAGPNQSDVQTATVNLFTGHNRAHDFAYRLGLTEVRGALQVNNFGKGGAELDPEMGNAQNAALSQEAFAAVNTAGGPAGEASPLTGRNNANQITLQDGVPGITNQYLFQPIPTFHGPCADGDLDSGIFLHEYTHAISNRLIAGPDTGLSGQQGGSMGESWSDLVAVEYLNAFGLAGTGGEDKFALGAYATGNVFKGIRDYSANPDKNPLNYSDFGFDSTGVEVHADGEIWNAVQMEIRKALITKYDAQFPYADKVLQKECAVGRTTAGAVAPAWNKCPGNRRYITYMFDAMIGQANGSPSMVDMKNVELASVLLRDKTDYDIVAEAFARRGLGKGAESATSADGDPEPSFEAPNAADNANVTFGLVDATSGKPVKGSIFVGMYHARCVPIATTLGGDEPDAKAAMTKGTYTFTVQASGYGIQRFTATLTPGAKTQVFRVAQNLASKIYGPSVTSNAGGLRLGNVLDDSEETNGAFDGQPVAGREITVKFLKPKQTFNRISVSALHHPAKTLPEGGTEIEGRFLGLRAFDLQASTDGGATFKTVYSSPSNFFPAQRPRPVAPDLIAREVALPKAITADAVKLVIRTSQCTGNPEYNTEEEADPVQPSACTSLAGYSTQVTVTELQLFKGTAGAALAPVAAPPVTPPVAGPLAATGGSTALGLGAIVLLGLAGAVAVYRRRSSE
ncbi:MAG: M36 family metallopeptidase [Frankiaceae bacterium]|nr:M36 family metallopeptidase [Frankiaceae bacterium]